MQEPWSTESCGACDKLTPTYQSLATTPLKEFYFDETKSSRSVVQQLPRAKIPDSATRMPASMIEFLMLSFCVYLHVAVRDVLNFDALCQKNQWSNTKKNKKLLQPTKTTTFGAACRSQVTSFLMSSSGTSPPCPSTNNRFNKNVFVPRVSNIEHWPTKIIPAKKKNVPRNLERWPLPSMVYRLHPDISTGLRCSEDKCCVSPFLKSREMLERTHDPNGTAFMAHRTTFALTTWQFAQDKESRIVTNQQKGHQNIDQKIWIKSLIFLLHLKTTSVLLSFIQWFDVI